MKNTGILFSIIAILFFGMFLTINTRRLTSGVPLTQTEAEAQAIAAEPEVAAGQAAVAPLPADADMAAAAEPERQPEPGAMKARSSVEISPLTGSIEAVEEAKRISLSREDYEKRLPELDNQIKKMKDSILEPSTDSMKKMADHEYRLWDNELNSMYQALISKMDEEENEALRNAEREWMGVRDQTARKASEKYSGGTLESLEYTAALAGSTRARVYELLELYGSYLDNES